MSVEQLTIAPKRHSFVTVSVLGHEFLSRDQTTGAVDEFWYLPGSLHKEIRPLGPEDCFGHQGPETRLEVLTRVPENAGFGSPDHFLANVNRTLAQKVADARDRFAGQDDWGSVARLNLALTIARPHEVGRFDDSKMWQEAYAAQKLLKSKDEGGKYFTDPETLTVIIAGMRMMYPDQLRRAVNEWNVFGSPFMNWIGQDAQPEARRAFKDKKTNEIIGEDLARLRAGDPNIYPGERLVIYWKEWLRESKGIKAEYDQFAQWFRSDYYQRWLRENYDSVNRIASKQNHLSDQELNGAVRGMFNSFIRVQPGLEGQDAAVERTRYNFLASRASADNPSGDLDWGIRTRDKDLLAGGLETAMRGLRNGIFLTLAFPQNGGKFIALDAGFFARFHELLLLTEADSINHKEEAGNYRGTGKTKLEIWAELAAGQRLLYPDLVPEATTAHPLVKKLDKLRNMLAVKTNSEEGQCDQDVLRLAELEASLALIKANGVKIEKDGLQVINETRNPFYSGEWVSIGPVSPVRDAN